MFLKVISKVLIQQLFILFPFALWAQSETFYVRKNGDGTAPKSITGAWQMDHVNSEENWASVKANDGKLGPGDTLIVLDDDGVFLKTLKVLQSGLPGSVITIKGEPGGNPIIDPPKADSSKYAWGILGTNVSYITVEDLELRDTPNDVWRNSKGVKFRKNSDHITLRRLIVYGHGENGINIQGDRDNIQVPDNILIEYCKVYNNGQKYDNGPSGINIWHSGDDITVRYNWIYGHKRGISTIDGNGIIVDLVNQGNIYIYGNIVYDNYGSGIQVTAATGSSKVYVYNNTLFKNGQAGDRQGEIGLWKSDDVLIAMNNILYADHTVSAYCFESGPKPQKSTLDYNLYYSEGSKVVEWERDELTFAEWQSSPYNQEKHGQFGNPNYVNTPPTTFSDLALTQNSPGINSGINLNAPFSLLIDPTSTVWPPALENQDSYGEWEKGAFVYTSNSPAPKIISKLVFITPARTIVTSGTSEIITVQSQSSNGTPVNVSANTTISLASNSPTGQFSADHTLFIPVNSITMTAGSNKVDFYYKDSTVGNPTITISENPDQGWSDAVQQATVVNSSEPSLTGAYIQRVNAGGEFYTGVDGSKWSADQVFIDDSWGHVAGKTYHTDHAIANTEDDSLFQSERYQMASYRFAVPNGLYSIKLFFAEIFFNTNGSRKFDVSLEGNKVLNSFDIFAETGHDVALVKKFTATVMDGIVDIEFTKISDSPKISAIEVKSLEVNDTVPPKPPTGMKIVKQ